MLLDLSTHIVRGVLSRALCAFILMVCPVSPAAAQGSKSRAQTESFSAQTVVDQARALAERPFVPPRKVADALKALDYDTYRQIRYRRDEAIWGKARTPFSIQLFAAGYLYEDGVDISVVEGGRARPIRYQPGQFDTPNERVAALLADAAQFAGFRLHYPINREDKRDEFIVFQGASYFRAVSQGQVYGLSARGLAIDVAEPRGEEFPVFRRFWIERPSSRSTAIVVHALLDSPRLTGAYRFGIYPRSATLITVDSTLFPRVPLSHVGLGALTSMFAHGAIDRSSQPDYRPSVHDSQGLAMHSGQGEWIWRPLNNPQSLQISAFVDENPKGFGLIQRDRSFGTYQDLEARYEKRPSGWIEPRGDWGQGHVTLVEIPSKSEFNDNMVAYWRPREPLRPGEAHEFDYHLRWPGDAPVKAMARVIRSAYGRAVNSGHHEFVIDYEAMPRGVKGSGETGARAGQGTQGGLEIDLSLSAGRIVNQFTQANPETGGVRVVVTFDPENEPLIEFRVQPRNKGQAVGETWLYRWLAR